MSKASGISQLDCNHVALLRPTPSVEDTVFCRRCREYRKVTKAAFDWSLYCASCRMARRYGQDERTCRLVAGRHAIKYQHKLLIKAGGEVVDEVAPPVTESLFVT